MFPHQTNMLKKLHRFLSIAILVVHQNCVTPYSINAVEIEGETLAVEGDIIVGGDTKIYLSLLAKLDIYDATFITDALVWVESTQGEIYTGMLVDEENTQPCFLIDTKSLSLDKGYKLCIHLPNGRVYESDFLTPLHTPEIGSIDFAINEAHTAVEFFVTTSGDLDSSPYYRWSYTEDWEITSTYRVSYYYDPILNMVVAYPYHPNNTYTYYCWGKARSTSILIARTDHLLENLVHRQKLNTIYEVDNRISNLYSMELYQISISKEAYTYWSTLEKHTSEMGTIFAPQLDWLNGNIRCVSDPDVKVIGYISAGTLSVQRIFVDALEMQVYIHDYDKCPQVTPPRGATYRDMVAMGYQIFFADQPVWWTPVYCVDCRSAGGTKNKPSFWPNTHI